MSHLPLTFRLRLPRSQSQGRNVSVPGVWVAGREWAGRELEAAEVSKKDWLLFTSLPQSSMQIQVHLKSEDIDISSAMITLLNEMIHISIKIFTPEVLFFFFLSLLPRKRMISYHLSDLTTGISSDLPKSH